MRALALIDFPDVRATLAFDKVHDMDDPLPGAAIGLGDFEDAARRLKVPIGCPMPIELRGGCTALEGVLRLDQAVAPDQFRATFAFMDMSSGTLRLHRADTLERRVAVPRFMARGKQYFNKSEVLGATIADVLEVVELTPLEDFEGW